MGNKTLKESERLTVCVPLKLTPKEHKDFKLVMKHNNERYATHTLRRLVQEAIEKDKIESKIEKKQLYRKPLEFYIEAPSPETAI